MISTFERRLDEIKRGIYSFREIGNRNTKKEIAEILLKEYDDGTITDNALNSLINYYIDEIKIFKKIDKIPENIKSLVINKLNNDDMG